MPKLLEEFSDCSFAILSSRSIDLFDPKKLTESLYRNQRFRIYTKFLQDRIGQKTFTHYQYEEYSSYLLVNNNCSDVDAKEQKIKEMFEKTYNFLPDIEN